MASLLIRDLAATTTCKALQGASVYGFMGPLYEQVTLVFYWWTTMIFHRILSKKHLVLLISVKCLPCVQLHLPSFFSSALKQVGKDNKDHVQKMEWPESALSDWETLLGKQFSSIC